MLWLCFQVQSPINAKPGLYLLWGGEASVQRPELPPPTENKIWRKCEKWCLSYEKSVFSFENGMFPFEKGCGIEKSLPALCTSWICVFIIIIIYNSLPLFYQMEVYIVRMASVLIVMMVSFNLHRKLVERVFAYLEIFALYIPQNQIYE